MKHGIRKRWWIGVFSFFLISTLTLPVFGQEASIQEVSVKGSHGIWKVNFIIKNCFTEKMDEAIRTGIKTTFTFYIRLYQKRKFWRDRKVASMNFQHSIQYDPIRGEYLVTLEESQSSHTTSNLEDAKYWMAKVEGLEIQSNSELNLEIPMELHIKAELDRVKLPFHLEYLFFFLSLWNFETKWHIEPLLPHNFESHLFQKMFRSLWFVASPSRVRMKEVGIDRG